jgi:ankyrin repeat protein
VPVAGAQHGQDRGNKIFLVHTAVSELAGFKKANTKNHYHYLIDKQYISRVFELVQMFALKDDSQVELERGLRKAACNNKLEALKIFIKLVHNIDAPDSNPTQGKTALHWAVIKNHSACVQELLQANADPAIKDRDGKTVRDYISNENEPVFKLLNLISLPVYQSTDSLSHSSANSSLAAPIVILPTSLEQKSPCMLSQFGNSTAASNSTMDFNSYNTLPVSQLTEKPSTLKKGRDTLVEQISDDTCSAKKKL